MTGASVTRFPAEWEGQDAVLIAWPHAGTDWVDNLADVESTYVALVSAITRFEPCLIVVADAALHTHASRRLHGAGVDLAQVRFLTADYDDTWLRDSGPVTLHDGDGFRLLDFRFTGWGGKFGASKDDLLIGALCAQGVFGSARHERIEFALEGGAIETDGEGTLLTTYACLHQRHPELSREQLAGRLREVLHVDRVLILEHGALQGDDTDAHIDTLARISDPGTIVHQACDDPSDPHFESLSAMAQELANLRTRDGNPYRLMPLPWAQPIHNAEGRRLAASYANYLVVNGGVLLPVYGDRADAKALAQLRLAYPDREVVPVPARPLIEQNGSLHCVTMQLPKGVLNVA
ncbi:MAG: agmatine deiminase family protein [Ahniella sp.]|nr:agmatine deiminase family protein [Ahniella sp.]